MPEPADELIDIYDANRQRTGLAVPRAGARMQPGQYMLYVLAVVRDPAGRILITQRAADKSWGALWWEVTGGGVLAGETSEQAVLREVREEVGLDVEGLVEAPIYTYENVDEARGDNYFVDVYEFTLNVDEGDVTLQESEAIACRFAIWEDIEALHEQGIFLHFERLRLALGK